MQIPSYISSRKFDALFNTTHTVIGVMHSPSIPKEEFLQKTLKFRELSWFYTSHKFLLQMATTLSYQKWRESEISTNLFVANWRHAVLKDHFEQFSCFFTF